MAGIQKGSSDNLTSPIPHLLNSDFLTAVARLAPGLIHYAGRDYYQRDTDTHYRLKALSKCFAADGTTPATLPGTWGTLEAHWVTAASAAAAPTNGTNGTNGNRILALAAAPALSDGNLADLAIVSAVGDLYEKTSSGWALRGNLRGPAGTGGTGTATSGVTSFNTRGGSITLTAADVLSVVSSANQLAGGLHSAANKSNMLSIPANLRDYGMTVIVYADSLVVNNGRYDLATDLQTWIKQGIDLTGQFQPYNPAILYNSSSAYVTYPDPVSSALRIFHSLALAAPATQPTPVNSSNVLNTVWEEISPSAAAATRVVQATNTAQGTVRGGGTGNVSINADGSMTANPAFTAITGQPTDNTNLNTVLTALNTSIATNTTNIGSLPSLATTNQTSIVLSINEIYSKLSLVSISRTLWVEGGTTSPAGVRGNPYKPFPNLTSAQQAASDGDTIIVKPGGNYVDSLGRTAYGDVYIQTKNLNIVCFPGVVFLSDFWFSSSATTIASMGTLTGGNFQGRILLQGQAVNSSILIENVRFSGSQGGIQHVPIRYNTAPRDTWTVRNCVFTNTARPILAGDGGYQYRGPIRINGTDDGGLIDVILDNVVVETTNTPAISYSTRPGSTVSFKGATEFRTGGGQPLYETFPALTGALGSQAQWLVDLRPIAAAATADTLSVLPYAASIAIDFNAETVRTLAATGNVAFAASVNVAALKTKELYISNTTGAAITLTFPAWSFFPGPAPTSLAAGKQAVLTLRSLGSTDSTIKAAYVAQV